MKKVAVIGHFGANEKFYDGQTIKTKNLEALLLSRPDFSVIRVDTYYFKHNKIKLLIDTIKSLLFCEHIFLLVSVNGLKVYLPLLYYLNRFTRKHIYHYIIGSEILEIIKQNKRTIKYLNSLESNWFEYESGTSFLRECGVKNVITVPNFKNLTPVSEVMYYNSDNHIYKFCTFSRVMREKGITEAIETIVRVNEEKKQQGVFATLDIYGPIDISYQEEFNKLLEVNGVCVTYMGCVDSQNSVDILKNYYALLFPTRWYGEGMPGTIIDAYASGVPVIATDWNANKDFIENMSSGIVYPSDNLLTLYDAVVWAIEHKDYFNYMRVECKKQFTKYTPETVLKIILDEINNS